MVRDPDTGDGCAPRVAARPPGWYQLDTHTEEYFRRRYSEYVEVVRFLPKAMDGCQTIAIVRPG